MTQLPPIVIAIISAIGLFILIAISVSVSFDAGYKQGWIVGSACTAAAWAWSGNPNITKGACAPP
jgi:hypothetical protein